MRARELVSLLLILRGFGVLHACQSHHEEVWDGESEADVCHSRHNLENGSDDVVCRGRHNLANESDGEVGRGRRGVENVTGGDGDHHHGTEVYVNVGGIGHCRDIPAIVADICQSHGTQVNVVGIDQSHDSQVNVCGIGHSHGTLVNGAGIDLSRDAQVNVVGVCRGRRSHDGYVGSVPCLGFFPVMNEELR